MVQRDYVDCVRLSGTERKGINQRKCSASGTFTTINALVVAILIMFIGGLYFITYNKSEETVIIPNRIKHTGNKLPPKPEERWRYIKELENRHIDVQTSTNLVGNKEANSLDQLTGKQYQLLEKIQTDERHKLVDPNKIPYNNQSQLPVESVKQKCVHTQVPCNPFNQQFAQPVQSTVEAGAAKKVSEAKTLHWLVQCGSFKEMNQAESVRAQLAFAGLEGHVITGGGWNRVLLGPYSSRTSANKILQSIHVAGVSNCIPIAARG